MGTNTNQRTDIDPRPVAFRSLSGHVVTDMGDVIELFESPQELDCCVCPRPIKPGETHWRWADDGLEAHVECVRIEEGAER